jgi:hypothetical protein
MAGRCDIPASRSTTLPRPVTLGALIVAIAQFGYQVYTDRKKKAKSQPARPIAQALRIERRKHTDRTGEEAEVIDIVKAKIIEHGDDRLPGLPGTRRAGGPSAMPTTRRPAADAISVN